MEKIGSNIVAIHGNCLDVMDNMKPDSVPLILTDPPYLMGYKTNHRSKDASQSKREKLLQAEIANDKGSDGRAFIRRYCQRLYRICADGGALYMFCKDQGPDGEDLLGFFKQQVTRAGFQIKNTLIWSKDNWTAGDLNGSFGFQYECIIFAHKGRHLLRGHRWSDIWSFPRVPDQDRIHPNQKPLQLLTRAIESSSDPGDLVFDGCGGSGSTALAAHYANRKAIVVELDQDRYNEMVSYLKNKINGDVYSGII